MTAKDDYCILRSGSWGFLAFSLAWSTSWTLTGLFGFEVITALLGWIDEGIQALLPNRVYDIRDVGFNALAGLIAIVSSLALTWTRQRWGKSRAE